MPITNEIYQMILDGLHITYTLDASTDQRIRQEIAAGMSYIREYCSPDADCGPGTMYGQMLLDYVLRAESGSTETFSRDFGSDITAGRLKSDVDSYAKAVGYAKTEE